MALGVLVVVGRFEGANGLAHKRKVSCQRTDGEDEGLPGIIPRLVEEAVFFEEHGCQAASAGDRIPAIDGLNFFLPGRKIDSEYSEIIPDHDTTSPASAAPLAESFCSRQSWGQ